MTESKSRLFLFLTASTVTNILSLTIPIVLMQTYDRTLRNSSYESHVFLIFGGLVAVLLETAIKLAKENLINHYSTEYEIFQGNQIINKILYGETKSINELSVGSLIDSFNSISTVKNLTSGRIISSLLDLPFVFLFLCFIAYLNLAIAIFLVLIFTLYFTIAVLHKRRFKHINIGQQETEEEKTSFFIDILSKISIVKSTSFEERLVRKYEFLEKKRTHRSLLLKAYDIVPDSLGVFFSQLVLFGILGIGSYFVVRGDMTIGVLTACVLLGNRFFQPVQSFVGFMFQLSNYQLALECLEKVLKIEGQSDNDLPDIPQDIDGSLQLKELTIMDEEQTLFKDLNFEVPAKKTIFIKSEDKSGISRLMWTILGQRRLHSGKISIDHYDSVGFNQSSIQNLIGYVPQKSELFNGTVLENITMFEPSRSQIALDCASMLGLDELISKLPQGYDTVLDSRSSQFMPNGIVLRIIMARVLLRHPKILILDRSYHSMDHDAQKMTCWLLQKLYGKMTIIFIGKNLPKDIQADLKYKIQNKSIQKLEVEGGKNE